VFIQFGHNDEAKDKVERYAPPDSFVYNLRRFVLEARAVGAIPVLLTPVSRRKFDEQGNALQTHAVYSPLVRKVAAEEAVVLIDLDEKSRDLYQQFGPDKSRLLFLQLQKGEHPNYPDGKEDNTHFSELGARLIAQLVLKDIQVQMPELSALIVSPVIKK
jgi:lysophospholipase L1-like esterase